MDEIDPNKIAAEVIIQATERTLSKASKPIRDRLRRIFQSISDAYSPFLERTLIRVSKIRTFLKPTESFDLLELYVPVDLTDKENDFSADEVIAKISKGENVVISGLAGRGKSVLMKYIALSFYHAPRGKIPLFLELRTLNHLTDKSILQLIHSQYKGDSNITFLDFIEALKAGYFVLILDGFDEIPPSDRQEIEKQIIDISDQYRECAVVISGRPYEKFYSWEKFGIFHLKPMNLAQTKELISKARYDEESKTAFSKRLNQEFFSKHESFLNTPLLAIMMMLTFDEFAEIPASLHEFYRNAFDTLVRRHDAMKSQFLRPTYSGCTADDIKRVFSSFCLLTYLKSAISFNRDEATAFLQTSIKQQGFAIKANKFLDDLIESVCLLQEEGFEISFVHRSFQEYFCALFVSTSAAGFVNKYLSEGSFRVYDDVLPMLYGMVPDRVETEWANDMVNDILKKYDAYPEEDRAWRMALDIYPSISIDVFGNSSIAIALNDGHTGRRIDILRRFYAAHFFASDNGKKRMSKAEQKKWTDGVKKEIISLEDGGDEQFEGFKKNFSSSAHASHDVSQRVITLNDSHRDLIIAMYADDIGGSSYKALKNIHVDQKKREKNGNNFLKELFG